MFLLTQFLLLVAAVPVPLIIDTDAGFDVDDIGVRSVFCTFTRHVWHVKPTKTLSDSFFHHSSIIQPSGMHSGCSLCRIFRLSSCVSTLCSFGWCHGSRCVALRQVNIPASSSLPFLLLLIFDNTLLIRLFASGTL